MEVGNSVPHSVGIVRREATWSESWDLVYWGVSSDIIDPVWDLVTNVVGTSVPDPYAIKKSAKRFVCPPTDEI